MTKTNSARTLRVARDGFIAGAFTFSLSLYGFFIPANMVLAHDPTVMIITGFILGMIMAIVFMVVDVAFIRAEAAYKLPQERKRARSKVG